MRTKVEEYSVVIVGSLISKYGASEFNIAGLVELSIKIAKELDSQLKKEEESNEPNCGSVGKDQQTLFDMREESHNSEQMQF